MKKFSITLATLTSAALLAAPLASAQASVTADDARVGGTPFRSQTKDNGDGTASTRAQASRAGKLSVGAFTTGGDGTILGSTPATADAKAGISTQRSVADGTYRVLVTYQGIKGSERDQGDADADVNRTTRVSFIGAGGGTIAPVVRSQNVPAQKADRTTKIFVRVPNGTSGRLRIQGMVSASSTASAQGASANAAANVAKVDVTVKRIGDN